MSLIHIAHKRLMMPQIWDWTASITSQFNSFKNHCLDYVSIQYFWIRGGLFVWSLTRVLHWPEVSLHGVFSIVYLIGSQNRNCYTMLPTKHPALSNAIANAIPWIAFKYKPLVTLPGLDNSSQAKNPYIDLPFSLCVSISMIPDLHLIMYLMPMATVLSCLLN